MNKNLVSSLSISVPVISYIVIFFIFNINGLHFANDLINLLIFISIIVFICCIGKIEKKTRGLIISLILFYCIFNIIISYFYDGTYVTKARGEGRKKECFRNIRIITSAVEMYNMDVLEKDAMRNLNIDKLIENGYIKEINSPELYCTYQSVSDLSDKGLVYCVSHGCEQIEDMNTNSNDNIDILNKIKEEVARTDNKNVSKYYNSNYGTFNSNVIKNIFENNSYLSPIRVVFFPETYNQFR